MGAGAPMAALGQEETADALAGASLAGVLLRVAPQWAPPLLEPYLRSMCALLASPEAAAQRRNARFVALVEARPPALPPKFPLSEGVALCLVIQRTTRVCATPIMLLP